MIRLLYTTYSKTQRYMLNSTPPPYIPDLVYYTLVILLHLVVIIIKGTLFFTSTFVCKYTIYEK